MNADAPRELSLDEVDILSMQAIDQITARLPVREYRTPMADDGSSSHVMEFGPGARFEVMYDRDGRPVDYRAEGVRFELLAEHIIVSRAPSDEARIRASSLKADTQEACVKAEAQLCREEMD